MAEVALVTVMWMKLAGVRRLLQEAGNKFTMTSLILQEGMSASECAALQVF